ncbi:hypothetical protein AcW1_008814 [Taiwanofungus camphoratus]|nr:hypothetical protein AcV5_006843 [Antrodia cinnamomea]KAI0949115.1 hypothetical protein AcW1_008814 [Antrodia cinnamomea]
MSTRQNKKRKGRSNVINRERTVTTLTEGPESSFLVPTPTEEPVTNVMSSPFSVSSSAAGGAPAMSPAGFQLPQNFGAFPYNNYMAPMHPQSFPPQHQQSFFHSPQVPATDSSHDLEVLEKLKESIKNGQHEFFRAVPQPAALASLYLGPRSAASQVSPHPEQVPPDHHQISGTVQQGSDTSKPQRESSSGNNDTLNNSLNGSSTDPSRRTQLSDAWDGARHTVAQPPVSEQQIHDNTILMSPASAALSKPYIPPSGYDSGPGHDSFQSGFDLRSKSFEARPAVPNAPPTALDNSQRISNYGVNTESPTQCQPGHQKHDQQSMGQMPSDKSISSDLTEGNRAPSDLQSVQPPICDTKDEARPRDGDWPYRKGLEGKYRHDSERLGPNGRFGSDSRFSNGDSKDRGPGRDQKFHDRERDRDRERERFGNKDRDWDRDRERDRRSDYIRFRDDRHNEDRTRFSDNHRPPEQRHYESRWGEPPRRYDPKPPVGNGPPRLTQSDDRILDIRHPRSLEEGRSIDRTLPDVTPNRTVPDDRRPSVPLSAEEGLVRTFADDRRGPPSGARPTRPLDDRRPPAPPALSSDRPPRGPDDHVPSTVSHAIGDRRPPIPPQPVTDRQMRPPDDRRPPPSPIIADKQARPGEDRRSVIPPSPLAGERQVRPGDERRPPVPPPSTTDRPIRPPMDDRRPHLLPSTSTDRQVRSLGDDRRPPASAALPEERSARPPTMPPADITVHRVTPEDRNVRSQATLEDRNARAPGLLEDRISRPPASLHDRIGISSRAEDRPKHPPVNSDDRRLATSLEERLSHATSNGEDRAARPPEERHARPPSTSAASTSVSDRTTRPVSADNRTVMAESDRPPRPARADHPVGRPEERGRPSVADRFTVPGLHVPPVPRSPYVSVASRTSSVAREDSRAFKPRSHTRSPTRPDVREFRPAGEPPRERAELRAPYRPEQDRQSIDHRPDVMDIDTSSNRFAPPASYRRSYTPVPQSDAEIYPPRQARPWLPPGEAYPKDHSRRYPVDEHGYPDWPGHEPPYMHSWESGTGRWERPATRGYDRDGHFVERDVVPNNGWETREERERRVSTSFPAPDPPSGAARSFEQRPLSSRLTDGFSGDDRGYTRDLERGRYPPIDSTPSFSRVRPRSPSPIARGAGGEDDLRPPIKRAREGTYAPGFYPPVPSVSELPRTVPPGGNYPPRIRTPPASGSATYYDDPRESVAAPYGSSAVASGLLRDRDYVDARERATDLSAYPPYDRHEPISRIPPPRSPPPYSRASYGRDDRRYSLPPRG